MPEQTTTRRTGRSALTDVPPRYRAIGGGLAIVPTVSVVVPAKNGARNLGDVFTSIPAWVDEIVLVDGQSTDDTVTVARQLALT